MKDLETAKWWDEIRESLERTANNLPAGVERQTVLNIRADRDALELVLEPYTDLEPRVAVYFALRKLFIG
jgi:hypothetical protein